jgi:hypothetical protein
VSTVVAHLAALGEQDRIAGLTLGVTVLDNRHSGTTSAFMDPATAAVATADSARRGYLDGRALAGVFAWLRPNDLVWNYWVSNYLLGKDPPAFDILYWNADTTNMPAALHRDLIGIALDNSLVSPGEVTVLGMPIDLSAITVDSYLVAGIADHITPWVNAYRSVHLLGSDPRFVLSTSGHIAALVNPPGNPKATRVNDELPEAPTPGWPARRRRRGLGGATGRRGWPSARARSARRRSSSAARPTRRWRTPRGPTCVSSPGIRTTGSGGPRRQLSRPAGSPPLRSRTAAAAPVPPVCERLPQRAATTGAFASEPP